MPVQKLFLVVTQCVVVPKHMYVLCEIKLLLFIYMLILILSIVCYMYLRLNM